MDNKKNKGLSDILTWRADQVKALVSQSLQLEGTWPGVLGMFCS